VQPIPLSLVRAGRELTEPEVSPDCEWVGFVQRWRGGSSINAVPVAGSGIERQLTFGPDPAPGRGLGGGCFSWASGGDGTPPFVYAAVDGELWRQRGVDLDRLTDHGQIVRAPAVCGDLVVYAVDEAEVWLLDLAGGESRRLDDGRHAFCFDPSLSPDGRIVSWQGWSPPDMPWDGSVRVDCDLTRSTIREWVFADAAVQQPRFTPHGEPVHVHDGSGWLNVHVGDRPVVSEPVEHGGPTWGMGNRSFAFDDNGTRMAFTRNERGHGALCVADLTTGVVEQIGRGVHGHLSWGDDCLVAIRTGARTPTQIVRYNTHTWTRTTRALSQPDVWPHEALPEPELIEVESSDGEAMLHARRFVAGQGRVLVWVHGGPTDQWQVDWRPRISYWWSRGWDVLVVDPRGTTGHGRIYQQALHDAWGRLDVDDTADLIGHAHASAWAAPNSTVVLGGSSGGLTVLGLLADRPDLVAGGVASYPVSDLKALTEVTHRFEAHYTDTLVAPNDGSPDSETAFAALSPIHRAARIAKPLLLMHGTDDPVVPIAQSEALAARIAESGGDVDFVVYEGEGHGFRQPDNVTDEYRRTEAFLDRVAR
jgi:dipeptidyl aminopeptidase/acylaminoacyl peptidase